MALRHRRAQGDVFGHVRLVSAYPRERQYSGHRGTSHLCQQATSVSPLDIIGAAERT